jgi:hypothetical protein
MESSNLLLGFPSDWFSKNFCAKISYAFLVSQATCQVHLKLIALMMGTASTSETSVNFYQTTRRNGPEDSHLHTRRPENLKSHLDSTGSG